MITNDENWIAYNNVLCKRLAPEVMIRRQRFQKQNFIRGRLCSQFGGIGRVWCFLSFNQGTEQSVRLCTKGNWTVRTKLSSKNVNRKGVVFHRDNEGAHTFLATRQELLETGGIC